MAQPKLCKLWISWTIARRSRELAPEFGARFYEFSWHKIPGMRNLIAFPATLAVILWHRPRFVFVQNPSIFAAALVVALKYVFLVRVIVDAHTLIIPLTGWKRRIFESLTRFIERNADLVIVTNRYLAEELESRGARCAILPDKIPAIPKTKSIQLPGERNIVFICTFAPDEPYKAVFAAARILDANTHITVTGNFYRTRHIRQGSLPPNVHLTGYLPDEEYGNVLHAADAILVLTSIPNCMLCGAYEAMAVEKPLILSNHLALRDHFSEGTVFVENDPDSIAQGIVCALKNYDSLESKIQHHKSRLQDDWAKVKLKVTNKAFAK